MINKVNFLISDKLKGNQQILHNIILQIMWVKRYYKINQIIMINKRSNKMVFICYHQHQNNINRLKEKYLQEECQWLIDQY